MSDMALVRSRLTAAEAQAIEAGLTYDEAESLIRSVLGCHRRASFFNPALQEYHAIENN
jgi:hypothetical protein